MKLMVLGYARHGKDTACEYLSRTYGLKHVSSSMFVAERVVYPVLKVRYGYTTISECYEDRGAHRKEWFDLIVDYNTPDLARLATELYQDYDIYCGLRNRNEFLAIKEKNLFDSCLWIDAYDRLGTKESKDSCTVVPGETDWIINNNRSEDKMFAELDAVYKYVLSRSSG